MRRYRDLKLGQIVLRNAIEIEAGERDRPFALDIPRIVAVQNRRDVLLGHGRPAEQRISPLTASVILARPLGCIVDLARVARDFVARPILSESVGLSDSRGPAASRIPDGLQIGAAHS